MKKILTLVLVMAMAAVAGSVSFTLVDNEDGTVDINYTGSIVGMALDIDSDVAISDVTLPGFFDVFMDYACEAGETYDYENRAGAPIAKQGEAGTASLPSSSFCISAGGLEDDELDTVPESGTITLTIAGYAELAEGTYTITVGENTLRGGVVDYDGAMTTDLDTEGSIDIVIEGQEPDLCLGDATGDGWLGPDDVGAIISYLNANADPGWGYYIEATPETAVMDMTGDGWIGPDDVGALISYLNANADPGWGYYIECE